MFSVYYTWTYVLVILIITSKHIRAQTTRIHIIQYLRRYMNADDFILKLLYNNAPDHELTTVSNKPLSCFVLQLRTWHVKTLNAPTQTSTAFICTSNLYKEYNIQQSIERELELVRDYTM